jgi:hypothetical protein
LDFDLNKEQEMIRKEVRKFAEKEIAPVALELDENETFSEDLTRKMGEIGLFGMFVSEEYDGQAMDYFPISLQWRKSPVWTAPRRQPSRPAIRWESALCTISEPKSRKRNICPNSVAVKPVGVRPHRTDGGIRCRRKQNHGGERRKRMGHERFQNFYHQCSLRHVSRRHRSSHYGQA